MFKQGIVGIIILQRHVLIIQLVLGFVMAVGIWVNVVGHMCALVEAIK